MLCFTKIFYWHTPFHIRRWSNNLETKNRIWGKKSAYLVTWLDLQDGLFYTLYYGAPVTICMLDIEESLGPWCILRVNLPTLKCPTITNKTATSYIKIWHLSVFFKVEVRHGVRVVDPGSSCRCLNFVFFIFPYVPHTQHWTEGTNRNATLYTNAKIVRLLIWKMLAIVAKIQQ